MIWVIFLIAAVAVNFAPNHTINTNCARSYRALVVVVIGALIGISGNNLAALAFVIAALGIFALQTQHWQK